MKAEIHEMALTIDLRDFRFVVNGELTSLYYAPPDGRGMFICDIEPFMTLNGLFCEIDEAVS